MAWNVFFGRGRDGLRAFRFARGGNVAFIFALALVPVFGFAGAAIDYSRANSAKSALQGALDAAELMLSKEADALTAAQLRTKANDIVKDIINRPEVKKISVTPTYDAATTALTLAGTAAIDTTVIRVLGMKQMNLTASSQIATWNQKKIELALVLDNTGSMASSGKIDALIKASQAFIDAMIKTAKNANDIKVAVIPFDTHVNIGTGNKDASWIDWSMMDGSASARTSAGNYGDADDDTRNDDDRINKDLWTGCVVDRQQPYDVDDTPAGGDSATWFPAVNCDLAPLLPLTGDFAAAKAMLGKMKADGKTDLTVGLVWGWHALTPNVPLTEGSAPAKNIEKYIVFLTDGLNTQNRWTTKAVDIDARTKLVCDKIKAAGIRMYTIRVMEGNQSLLQNCASNPSMYYNVTSASQIAPVFTEIAQSLIQLRITR